MFGIKIPWLKIAGLLAVIGVIWGAVKFYESQSNKIEALTKTNGELIATRDNLLEVNAAVNGQLVEMVKDRDAREQVQQTIVSQKQELSSKVGDLNTQLEKAIQARKDAEQKSGYKQCMDPNPGKPLEVDIAWKAYCAASKDPKCKAGSN